MTNTQNATDPKVHAEKIQKMLQDLIDYTRRDQEKVEEPRFQALLETTAEVLIGVRTAFADYSQGKETAWKH